MGMWVPVLPYLVNVGDAKNVVLSLLGVAEPSRLALTQVPDSLPADAGLDLESTVVSLDAMTNFGFTSAVNVSLQVHTEVHYLIWNLLCVKEVSEPAGGLIQTTRWGIGVRIGITAFDVDAKVKIDNAANVAAAASLNMASAIYEVQVLGGNLDTLGTLKPLLGQSAGSFNTQTLQALGAVQGDLLNSLKNGRGSMIPSLLRVEIDPRQLIPGSSSSFKETMTSQNFALERAYRGTSAADARSQAEHSKPRDVTPSLVTDTYQTVLHLDGKKSPPSATVNAVNHILTAGR